MVTIPKEATKTHYPYKWSISDELLDILDLIKSQNGTGYPNREKLLQGLNDFYTD